MSASRITSRLQSELLLLSRTYKDDVSRVFSDSTILLLIVGGWGVQLAATPFFIVATSRQTREHHSQWLCHRWLGRRGYLLKVMMLWFSFVPIVWMVLFLLLRTE